MGGYRGDSFYSNYSFYRAYSCQTYYKIKTNTMIKFLINLFSIEKKPRRGLFAFEWVMMAYLVFTLLLIILTYTKAVNPDDMIWGRVRVAAITVALWGVYSMLPCRFTRFVRIVVQLALLGWWYPDTYEINRMFPNLDHVFASLEQWVFGCQPALLFSRCVPWHFFSEMMDMGYASYYPMIVLVTLFYFFRRPREFECAAFVVLTSFFIYYVIFVLVPVTGPTFYYKAVGVDNIAAGIFPSVGDYFNTHTGCLPSPGNPDGFFYGLVESAKEAGERPTAAFPSSHVGITTVLVLLAWHTRNRRLFFILLPFYVLMCFATVYIQAHYAIDSIAGLLSGALLYAVLMNCYKVR